MKISAQRREQTRQRIRATIDLLLSADRPAHLACDTATLAAQAGVARSALYTTYADLRTEFEHRRAADQAHRPDPRTQQQVTQLVATVTRLRRKLAERDAAVAELTAICQSAVSRLAAQHEQITRLKASRPDVKTPGLTVMRGTGAAR